MKETVEIVKCDDCGRNISHTEDSFTFGVNIDSGSVKDLCWQCVKDRVRHSFSIVKSPKCPTCSGKGMVKEHYGYHNDYEWKTCPNCSGKGKVI